MGLYTVDLTGKEDSIKFGGIDNKKNELEAYVDILETRLNLENLRLRTIHDYMKWYKHYIRYCVEQKLFEVAKLDANSIYGWLDSMKVADSTKNIWLKSLMASLNRLDEMGAFLFFHTKSINSKQFAINKTCGLLLIEYFFSIVIKYVHK